MEQYSTEGRTNPMYADDLISLFLTWRLCLKKASCLLPLAQVLLMWLLQVRSEATSTPRQVVDFTLSKVWLWSE